MSCIHLPKLGFDEFNRQIKGRRAPLQGGIELTHRCNVRCVHCYCRQEANDQTAQSQEMSLEEIRDLVDQIAAEECLYLFLTGGEPLLRKDFVDIYDYVRSKGFLVTLFTNGTLITERLADHLAQNPPFCVEISLYGATREAYESITGIPGSFARCQKGISLLLERGITVILKTPLMEQNRRELGALKLMAEQFGVPFYYDVQLHPRLEGMEDVSGPYRYALPIDDMLALELAEEAALENWKVYLDRLSRIPRERTLYQCGAGLYAFFVDATGKLSMCVESRSPAYDLRQGTFREGWHEFLKEQRFTPYPSDGVCAECALHLVCNHCPGRSQLEYGDQVRDGRVEWLCRLAHARADAFAKRGIFDAQNSGLAPVQELS